MAAQRPDQHDPQLTLSALLDSFQGGEKSNVKGVQMKLTDVIPSVVLVAPTTARPAGLRNDLDSNLTPSSGTGTIDDLPHSQ